MPLNTCIGSVQAFLSGIGSRRHAQKAWLMGVTTVSRLLAIVTVVRGSCTGITQFAVHCDETLTWTVRGSFKPGNHSMEGDSEETAEGVMYLDAEG